MAQHQQKPHGTTRLQKPQPIKRERPMGVIDGDKIYSYKNGKLTEIGVLA